MSDDGDDKVAPSTRLATAIFAELIARGVRDVIVCPGSRSQALALLAAEAERLGEIRLHVRVDERSAGFFALGLSRETGMPAAVIVTSGTAVANLLPAALEAFHARVPMILLSADRPPELRGIRANQTVQGEDTLAGGIKCSFDLPPLADDEHDIEASLELARATTARAVRLSIERGASGPVHMNIGFRDPLSGGVSGLADAIARAAPDDGTDARARTDAPAPEGSVDGSRDRSREALDAGASTGPAPILQVYEYGPDQAGARTVVAAGAEAGSAAVEFARRAGIPLLAEPSSGARYGREAIQHWQELLRAPEFADAIERVVAFGHPTLTRELPALLQRDSVETVVVDETDEKSGFDRYNPGRAARAFARTAAVSADLDPAPTKGWLGRWIVADRALRAAHTTMHEPDLEAARATDYRSRNSYARAEVAAQREPVTREHLTEAVWLATWPHDRLVVAASRLVRVLNRMAAPRNIRVHANRGLSGIDGTVATALGIAAASQAQADLARAAGTTRVLLGDLALLHDAGSLILPPDGGPEPRPRVQLFVANDGGGTIFDTLEAAGTAVRGDFDRVMYTPQRVDLRALAEAYGWSYVRVATRGELDRLLTAPVTGPSIVEVPINR